MDFEMVDCWVVLLEYGMVDKLAAVKVAQMGSGWVVWMAVMSGTRMVAWMAALKVDYWVVQ